ncbi:hypothetical protein P3X46_027845 [Hevea brasiliensis]|uniref:DUF4005 domain-containing protein n=1 Tax=Hevea brasiliensis TaxID=3981 RepID=A0ABQ9L4A8_HEVBR|nr:uncharacterized protein LOC110673938 [Hevea brasiliensis]KAJ9154522.1 hypothetical protein P3X46_027845 [Hevea brasiliensis]
MANKTPIFPMPEPHHYSDYGFDPQINYFQFLEEARKHKRETVRSIDSSHFKLQKPISKDESNRKIHKTKKKRWWRKASLFFKWKWIYSQHNDNADENVHKARARAFRASVSGPVYVTESRSGSSTPYRTTSSPSSGPLAGTLTPARKGDLEIPYLSLRELNMEHQQQRMSTSAMPVYLVT